MKKQILKIYKNPLFAGSVVMIIGSNIANFFAYIYHLLIGRMLGPAEYGELASIISLIGLFSVTFGFLGLVVVKFVSSSKEKEVSVFFNWVRKRTIFAAAAVGIVVFFASGLLSEFLNSSISPMLLVGPILFVYFVGFIYRSFLQGLLQFGKTVLTSNVDLGGRLLLGVVLVYLGFGVFGGILGIFVSSLASLILTHFFLKKYVKNNKKSYTDFNGGKEVWIYSIPIFVMSIATNSMYMSDVILVKHFFEPHLSGIYASLSTLGKIIYFGAAPISTVMFPLVSKRTAEKGSSRKIFLLSFALTAAISLGVLFIYWAFPNVVINTLYGKDFLEGSKNLIWFGAFMAVFTFNGLLLNYFLSKNITKPVYLALFAAIAQLGLIWFFHASILGVVKISLSVSLVLFAGLLSYLVYETGFGRNSGLQIGKGDS